MNLEDEVIGINTAIASRTGGNMGIGFAIPSSMAEKIKAAIEHGKVERRWLGAAIQNLTKELAVSFDYDSTKGVLIGDAIADGPAARAGLRQDDIVDRYDGRAVTKRMNCVTGLRKPSRVKK